MARELGGSQISALLESVPGIVNVLRNPVADALVGMIRAGAGLEEFSHEHANELVQYAVRRGLVPSSEGEQVLQEVGEAVPKKRGRPRGSSKKKTPPRKPPPAPKPTAKAPVKHAPKPTAKAPVKHAPKAPVKRGATAPVKQAAAKTSRIKKAPVKKVVGRPAKKAAKPASKRAGSRGKKARSSC